MSGPSREGLIWMAWKVAEDGSIVAVATLRDDEGHLKERWEFDSLEEAADALGEGFRDVAERVLETGRRSGRWRP